MLPEMWQHILAYISSRYLSHPLSKPLLPQLYSEISSSYEDTIRKTTSNYIIYAYMHKIIL